MIEEDEAKVPPTVVFGKASWEALRCERAIDYVQCEAYHCHIIGLFCRRRSPSVR